MKYRILAVTLISANLVQAAEHVASDGEVRSSDSLHGINEQVSTAHNAEDPVKLSGHKRGLGPVLGMPCEGGFRLVGDECVMSNVEFE